MEKFFQFKKYGTNLRTEVVAGFTTFFAMAYIMFVNPQMLSLTGMDYNAVFVATIICSVIGTLFMGLFANVPYALAPGMGLNAFFTFTVCFAMGFTWQQALALVLVCGIINTIVTVTGFRKKIIKSIPGTLQAAISGGIGMFIAYIGLKNGGLLKFTADAPFLAVIPSFAPASDALQDQIGTVVASSAAVPALVNFSDPGVILTLIGLAIMLILIVKQVKGSILIGILATTLIGIPMGVVNLTGVNFSAEALVTTVSSIELTAFKMDFAGLFETPTRTLLAMTAAIGFCLTDIFDCIGTFIGTGRKSGIFNEEEEKRAMDTNSKGFTTRMDKALFADLVATTTGAFFGTSNTTTYVESAAGIAAGGRTGFTAVVTAGLFAVSILLAPIAGVVPPQATAAALIVVGIMMMAAFTDIKWSDFEVAAPCFLVALLMPVSYSITNGIAAGFIVYVLINLAKGQTKNLNGILYVVSGLFILNFILQAIYHL